MKQLFEATVVGFVCAAAFLGTAVAADGRFLSPTGFATSSLARRSGCCSPASPRCHPASLSSLAALTAGPYSSLGSS